MIETYHVYTSKRHVLCEINSVLLDKGDFKYLDILIFKKKGDYVAEKPESYDELQELLKDCDSVYSFNRVETKLHGAVGYDIIISE